LLAFTALSALADVSVPLAWNPSPDVNVAGYKIYYGGASRTYTNSVDVGNVTSTVITGLAEGTTYFFAATTYGADGVESDFSDEAVDVTTNSTVTPPPVYQPPTLDALEDLTINENAGAQTISLTGISLGSGQALNVSAVSSNPALIPAPAISYNSPDNAGTLTFAPVTNMTGTAVITVTVNNGAAQSNIISRSFTVTVVTTNELPTLDPLANVTLGLGSDAQTLALTGISPGTVLQATSSKKSAQPKLKVTAKSSNSKLIRALKIVYASPNSAGTLTFKPAAKLSGTATITVTVTVQKGLKKISTSQKFTVTVLPQNPATNATASVVVKAVTKAAVSSVASTSSTLPAPAAPAFLESAGVVDGHFSFTVTGTGTAGSQYAVQSSADLVNWTSMQTNTAPFVFTDLGSSATDKKFYRAASVSQP
jgi:hypothetical protein